MRAMYREKTYKCGDYLEAEIFPVFPCARSRRAPKAAPTSEVQQKLNERRADRRLARIVEANFTCDDIKAELTYRNDALPDSDEQAMRDVRNFIRRLKRLRVKKGLPALKYVKVLEKSENVGRYHHHVIMSGGVLPSEISKLWRLGYVMKIQPLEFTEDGVDGLCYYFLGNKRGKKIDKLLYRRYDSSKNLIIPEAAERDDAVSENELASLAESESLKGAKEYFEQLYKGYIFKEVEISENPLTGGYYAYVKMYSANSGFLPLMRRRM